MLCGVLVGVALPGFVKLGFLEPYPLDYARAGCVGLAGYLTALWMIQKAVQARESYRFARTDIRVFGIVVAASTYLIVSHVPSIIGNLFWGTALFSQIGLPLWRAAKTYTAEPAI